MSLRRLDEYDVVCGLIMSSVALPGQQFEAHCVRSAATDDDRDVRVIAALYARLAR